MEFIKGKTSTGFEFNINKKRLNNYELVENLGRLEDEPLLLPKVVNMMLGAEQAKLLKDHIRDEDGIVDTEIMTKELEEILKCNDQVKN